MDITGLILAGGQGSRMGGVDKGLVHWQQRPLVSYCLAALKPLCTTLLISCNRNQDQYALMSGNIVSDQNPDFQGPLSGLVSAFPLVQSEWLMVAPCDTPKITSELMALLTSQASDAGIYALKGERKDHPLHCLIHRTAFSSIEMAFNEGKRSVYRVFNDLSVEWVDVPEESLMANINALTDA
ncbi:molybdenum cofactor guanylyltransferase MobA [Litoribacillus peritrichatus]|uniref:Molybdenum cofactor guanylyltransferase n=1 Tax=Litoribacillus peritrichatus TaxID=718191 RepID=A0ABP7MJ12_9GAMM